jgi:fluoride ion exporter CrcB/FEX
VRAFVVPGILGGLTSYSAVFTDAHTLWTLEPVAAAVLVAGSVLVGVVAAWAGQRVAR